MNRTIAQIEKDGYQTLTEEEAASFSSAIQLLVDSATNKWPKQWGEACDLLLRTYGWHIRLWMHPDELIPFMLERDAQVDRGR